jgi:hypothetical protein
MKRQSLLCALSLSAMACGGAAEISASTTINNFSPSELTSAIFADVREINGDQQEVTLAIIASNLGAQELCDAFSDPDYLQNDPELRAYGVFAIKQSPVSAPDNFFEGETYEGDFNNGRSLLTAFAVREGGVDKVASFSELNTGTLVLDSFESGEALSATISDVLSLENAAGGIPTNINVSVEGTFSGLSFCQNLSDAILQDLFQ